MKKIHLNIVAILSLGLLLTSCSGIKNVRSEKPSRVELYIDTKPAYLNIPGSDIVLKNLDGSGKIDTLRLIDLVDLKRETFSCFIPMHFWRILVDVEDGYTYELKAAPLRESDLRFINEQKLSVSQRIVFSSIKYEEKWIIRSIGSKGKLMLLQDGTYGFIPFVITKRK